MILPEDRSERVQVYAKALGRSPADIEAQLCLIEPQQAGPPDERLDMPQLVERIAQQHGTSSAELLRRALLLAQKIRSTQSE